MSDVSQGPGWWQASDGKWYPPKEADQPPAEGWWLASDGKWYPPTRKPGSSAAATDAAATTAKTTNPAVPAAQRSTAQRSATRESGRASSASGPKSSKPAAPAARTTGRESGAKREDAGKAKPSTGAPAKGVQRPAKTTSKAKPETEATTPSKPRTITTESRPTHTPPTRANDLNRPAEPKPARTRARTGAGGADPAPAPAPPPPPDVGRPNTGMTPQDQLQRRNQASRADANVLAPKRAAAASRAVLALQAQIEAELAGSQTSAAPASRPGVTRAAGGSGRAAPAQAPAAPAAPTTPAAPSHRAARPSSDVPSAGTVLAEASAKDGQPVLELKSSPLSADIEHLGDRLAIFPDRVELHDRLDRVRRTIPNAEIVDVAVQKRLAGVQLTVEPRRGQPITAKGLRLEQAEEARALILSHRDEARAGSPATPEAAASGAPAPAPANAAPGKSAAKPAGAKTAAQAGAATSPAAAPPPAANRPGVNEAELLRKLGDLHRAGVLTDEEYADKIELVERLVRGDLAPTGS